MNVLGRFTNVTEQSVGANAPITFNDIATTPGISSGGAGLISIKTPGVYAIQANFEITATAAQPTNIMMKENGVNVVGARSAVVPAAVGDVLGMSFSTLVKVKESFLPQYATLSFVPNIGTTVSLANVVIEKVS